MRLSQVAIGVLIGLALGAAGRWLTWEDVVHAMPGKDPLAEASQENQNAGEDQKALPATRVTLEEISQARGDAFLSKLVSAVSTAQPTDLEALLTTLKAQHRSDRLAKELIFLRWMELDPAGGLMAARDHDLLRVAYWAWGTVDAEAALAGARGEGDHELMANVLRAIGQSDPERAMALIEEVPEWGRRTAWDGILEALSHKDPQRGVEMALRLNQENSERIKDWMRIDPEKALPWLNDHHNQGTVSFLRMCETLFHSHLDRAPELLASLPEGWNKTALEIEYASRLSETKDLEVALALLREKSSSAQDHARGAIVSRLARSNPESAFEVLNQIEWENPPPNPSAIYATSPGRGSGQGHDISEEPVKAISALMEVDPHRTAEFLETLPDSGRVRNAYAWATKTWIAHDSMEASRWLAGLSPGRLKDAAIQSMNSSLTNPFGSDPDFEAAARWSLELSRANAVESELSRVFEAWQELDPESFMSGLEIPGLPASIVDRFRPKAPDGP